MKRLLIHIALLILLAACGTGKKRLNERVTLWRNDKIPYGAYYFHQHLQYIFPEAEVVIDKESPRRNGIFRRGNQKLKEKLLRFRKKSAQIVLAAQVQPDADELQALMEFVWEGNYVFMSSFGFGQQLLDSLHLDTRLSYGYFNNNDSLIVSIKNPVSDQMESFSYPGKTYDNYFSRLDSSYVTILGTNEDGQANFIRIRYESGGAIYLHLAPMAFTNFFLLHKQNKKYYDYALSYLPKGIRLIAWGEYFRNHRNGNGSGYNRALSWIMNQPSLAAAAWLLLVLLAAVFLIESKRRQRIVEALPALRNASLDFVRTVGRLYYQRHDNRDLAGKMSAHFLDHVRRYYNLPTSVLDDNFEKKLAFKTGYDAGRLHQLIYQVKHLPEQPHLADDELLAFNAELDQFYKHT